MHPTHWFISTLAKTVPGARLAAADLSEEPHEVRQAVARAAGDLCGNNFTKRGSRVDATSVQIHFHAESVPRGGGPRPLPPGPRGGGPRLCENRSVFTKSNSVRRLGEILISTPFFAVARLAAAGRAAAGPWAGAHGAAGRAAVLPWCFTLEAALSSLAAAFAAKMGHGRLRSSRETVPSRSGSNSAGVRRTRRKT